MAMHGHIDVVAAWAITGDWDTIVLVRTRTAQELSSIREMIVDTGHIDEIETEIHLEETLFTKQTDL